MRMLSLRSLIVLIPLLTVGVEQTNAQQSAARQWNEELLSAIRRNVPNPPGHARNLHHTAVAMYDAWAAYDPTAVGYLYNEKVSPLPGDIEAARAEAISYAAYRVLRSRFASGAGSATSLSSFDTLLTTMGYSTSVGQAAITNGTTSAEVGKRIGQAVLTWGAQDGFSNTTYPQAYNATVNPNLNVPLSVLGTNASFTPNMPLGYGVPVGTDPNLWQPLDLATSVTQNGIPIPGGAQTFVGVQSLATLPFSLTRNDPTKPWIDIGPPSRLSRPGQPSATDAEYKNTFMDVVRKTAHLNDTNIMDISPGAIGNNPLGTDTGTGYSLNPITSTPYAPNNVVRGDFVRVLAEFWADGPNSETPPGHWHVLANEVADNPLTVKKIKGVGPTVNNLEWDVKTYLSLSGAVHNAACASWALKRYYSGTRPITAIRYMCSKGQSSDPQGPAYDPEGIPLETDVTEVITAASVAPGGHHENIWDVNTGMSMPGNSVDVFGDPLFIGKIAIKGWPGEDPNNLPAPSIATHQSTVKWMLGKDWLPFQRKTFNTPAFPGYISGHSTFSRSSAEVLTLITGSPYFPGGFGHHTIAANSMQIDLGPSAPVDLQWASYYDAADQAGQSRRWGGIHPYEDDFPARTVGSQAGISAFTKAEKYWTGSIQSESIQPIVTMLANGDALVTWPTIIGHLYKVQESTNMTTWTDSTGNLFASSITGSFTDTLPAVGTFYRIVETTPSVARMWNEQLLNAIRRNVPNPPGHARNLFHTAIAMYDAWAAYDTTAVGYIHHERDTAGDITAARKEAISYAAYRVLRSRFATGAGAATSLASFDSQLTALGYSTSIGQATTSNGTAPAEVGKRIGQAILTWGASDGFSNTTYPQAYTATVNPNLNLPLSVLGTNAAFVGNMPLGYGIPVGTDPNLWQPLDLATSVTQNGIPIPGGAQTFVGVQSLATLPFSLVRNDPLKPWLDPYGGPSRLSRPGDPSATDVSYKDNFMDNLRKSAWLNDNTTVNISPAAVGNNPLGTDNGTGRALNPVTNQTYSANNVKRGDFARVLAEFWADGPNSETPPGHWHVLANEVSDDPLTVKKIKGVGPIVDDLQWDVKTYLSVSAATHDAACAAWALKRYYSGTRPITAIRYMCSKGQSSDSNGPSYNPEGIPLEPNVVEVITVSTAGPGGKHEQIWDVNTGSFESGSAYIGQIAVYSWPGEHPNNLPAPSIATNQSTVRWMLGKDWLPFQRKTFNTPAFPGYVSGHSTFSRSAAEVLTLITGSSNFPGGFHHHTIAANSLQIDLGPSADVDLQWTSYYDAADQAGLSRRYGGIHPYEDDFHGRVIGSMAGKSAFGLAEKYWSGTILADHVVPTQTFLPGGGVTITCNATRGLYYHLESSTNLIIWTPVTSDIRCTETTLTFTDPSSSSGPRFYRVVFDAKSS